MRKIFISYTIRSHMWKLGTHQYSYKHCVDLYMFRNVYIGKTIYTFVRIFGGTYVHSGTMILSKGA